MSEVLETAKFAWDVVKGGLTVNESRSVSVLPKGATPMDFDDWSQVSFDETFEETSLLGHPVADLMLTTAWEYNGQYIANFHVRVDGGVGLLSSVDVSITTFEAHRNSEHTVELPYEIKVLFRNLASGSRLKTIRATADGNGGGRSLP